MANLSTCFVIHIYLLLAIPAMRGVASTPSSSVCKQLSMSLPGKVLSPNTSSYEQFVTSYFFTNEELSPSCAVIATSAADVATFVKTIGACRTQECCEFAIRGGGMAANAGTAAINKGITLDMSGLKSLALSDDASILEAGGGATWGEVYTYLDPKGLGVTGSRISSSGLGGSLLGGGLSFFSPRRGFSCDGIRNIEIVLASGKITNANATSNRDLFRALKGGSNNFGIVTRFDLVTFPQTSYWGGAIEYPESSDSEQLRALAEFKNPDKYDPDAESELSFLYLSSENSFTSANNMFYAKPIVNASGLTPFLRVMPQKLNTMRIANSSYFANEIYNFSPKHTYGILATFSFRSSLPLFEEMHSIWKNSTRSLQKVANLTYNLDFQGIPPATQGSDNSLGTPPATAELTLLLLSNYWTSESDSQTVMNATETVFAQLHAAAKREGLLQEWQYINYASPWQQPLRSYGVANHALLRAVAAKYDPSGMFQTQVPGGFKLDSA